MDIAIELAKCKEAAVRLCDSVGITAESQFCGSIATALLEARADALYSWGTPYGREAPAIVLASRDIQREVAARRLRGL